MAGVEKAGGLRPGRWLLGRGWWFLPALLASVLALPWVFGERWYSDTPYYQAIATQMVRDGCWWSPMQGDLHYFNKPPLAFWIHAGFIEAFGQRDWSTHAPEAIFFMVACVLVAWLARRFHGPLVGVLAGCALALTNEWIWRVGNFKLDALHTVLLLSAIACWVRAFVPAKSGWPGDGLGVGESKRTPAEGGACWGILAGVCLGAALMTKPVFGLGAAALIVLWLGMIGQLTRRRLGLVGLSVLVGIALAAPWHVSMILRHGSAFTSAYIHEQTLQRALGEMHDHQPWDWYLRLIAGTVPEAQQAWKMWPLYGLAALGLCVRWRAASGRGGDVLVMLWTVGWFVAMSVFGGKRNYYLMVMHPGTAWLAAIALGALLAGLARRWNPDGVRKLTGAAAVVGVVAIGGVLAHVPHTVRKAIKELPVPERNEFMAFVRSQRTLGREVYDCGLSYRIDALTYIETGYWPRCASERTGVPPDKVPAGALAAYRDDMLAKGVFGTYVDPKDRLVFRSSPNGQYMVYQRHTDPAQPPTP